MRIIAGSDPALMAGVAEMRQHAIRNRKTGLQALQHLEMGLPKNAD
jgi:hypothetical protein